MHSKTDIFNLALAALLLERRVDNAETDRSKEANTLRTHWLMAWRSTLQDMDLDSTATKKTLELVATDPNTYWKYAYKYPSDCAFFRRIRSCRRMDNRYSHISKEVSMHGTVKCIFTNEYQAVADYISADIEPIALSEMAGMAVAYRLAMLSAPLIVGKGAKDLRDDLAKMYVASKGEAAENDRRENFVYEDETENSEFVAERMS